MSVILLFIEKGYPINNQQRNLARNHAALPLKSLFQGIQQLLLPKGSCSLILPVEQAEEATELAGIHGLYLSRVTKVRGHATADFKRVLLAYSRTKKVTQSTTLTLELSRHERTLEHQALVDSFLFTQALKIKNKTKRRKWCLGSVGVNQYQITRAYLCSICISF